MVLVGLVVCFERKEIMTSGDSKESVPDPEIRTHGPLHRDLATSDGKAEKNRYIVDDVFEGITVFSVGEEGWAVATQFLIDRPAECNIDILDVELVEVPTNVPAGSTRLSASETAGSRTDPDGGVGIMTLAVFNGLDARYIVIGDNWLFFVILAVVFIVIVVIILDFLVRLLVEPRETNKVHRRGGDGALVEQSDHLSEKR